MGAVLRGRTGREGAPHLPWMQGTLPKLREWPDPQHPHTSWPCPQPLLLGWGQRIPRYPSPLPLVMFLITEH